MAIKKSAVKFCISEKGNVDEVFKEYGSDRLLACKTKLKEGKLENFIYTNLL